MDCSPPGSSVHGLLQARILEWVTMPSSRESVAPRNQTRVSCVSWIGRQVLYRYCHLGSPVATILDSKYRTFPSPEKVWLGSANLEYHSLIYPFVQQTFPRTLSYARLSVRLWRSGYNPSSASAFRASSQEDRQMNMTAWRWDQHVGYQSWLLLRMQTWVLGSASSQRASTDKREIRAAFLEK